MGSAIVAAHKPKLTLLPLPSFVPSASTGLPRLHAMHSALVLAQVCVLFEWALSTTRHIALEISDVHVHQFDLQHREQLTNENKFRV